MIDETKKTILKQAFKTLNAQHIENFRFHLKNESPVLCGKRASQLPYEFDGVG